MRVYYAHFRLRQPLPGVYFMDLTRNINGKLLRCGYTTGSCAAGAAKAATQMLLTGKRVDSVELDTPKGIRLTLDILDGVMDGDRASCAVRKDSGDDPDVTAGMLVYATAERIESGITIDGGEGVGRVTKPGYPYWYGSPDRAFRHRRLLPQADRGALLRRPSR